jgi:hypothetical protein
MQERLQAACDNLASSVRGRDSASFTALDLGVVHPGANISPLVLRLGEASFLALDLPRENGESELMLKGAEAREG